MEDKRKLQELGGSLYLSLPREWTGKYNLKKGSEVCLSGDEAGELHIFPEKARKEGEKIESIDFDRYFFRNLIGKYLDGCDIVKVRKKGQFNAMERQEIEGRVNNLMNLQVVEEQSDCITIQNLKSDIPIKKMLAMMYYLTRSMLEDLGKKADKELLQSIIDRDRLVGKYYLAIIMQQRSLLTNRWSKELSFVEILDLRLIAQRIELIGDEIKSIAGTAIGGAKIPTKDIKFLLDTYETAYNCFVKMDTDTAKKFWDREKPDRKRLAYNEAILRIYDNIKDITDLVI